MDGETITAEEEGLDDTGPVCAGCGQPADEGEQLYPLLLNPEIERDDPPALAVDRSNRGTVHFDRGELQDFLDDVLSQDVSVVADHVFQMHAGCIKSLFGVDVAEHDGVLAVSERDYVTDEPSDRGALEQKHTRLLLQTHLTAVAASVIIASAAVGAGWMSEGALHGIGLSLLVWICFLPKSVAIARRMDK